MRELNFLSGVSNPLPLRGCPPLQGGQTYYSPPCKGGVPPKAARGSLTPLLTLVLILAMVGTSYATIVPKMDLPELVQKSDSIIEGHVDSVVSQWDPSVKLIYTYISIRIDEQVKGSNGQSLTIKQVGGRVGSLDMNAVGMPVFKAGQQVVLFLKKQATGGTYEALGLDQGVYQVVNNIAVSNVSGVEVMDEKTGKLSEGSFVSRAPLAMFKSKIRELMK